MRADYKSHISFGDGSWKVDERAKHIIIAKVFLKTEIFPGDIQEAMPGKLKTLVRDKEGLDENTVSKQLKSIANSAVNTWLQTVILPFVV
jgi:hypothetical protein